MIDENQNNETETATDTIVNEKDADKNKITEEKSAGTSEENISGPVETVKPEPSGPIAVAKPEPSEPIAVAKSEPSEPVAAPKEEAPKPKENNEPVKKAPHARSGNYNPRGRDSYDRKPFQKNPKYRKKFCRFCFNKDLKINYRDAQVLEGFITERGKILPRRITGSCARHQRELSRAIKQARILSLLPFVVK